jgi:biopolymer transport protein ExbB/TolQ
MEMFFTEMGLMRWPMVLATVFMFFQIGRAAWQILSGKESDAMTLHAVLVWGALCALLGVLGTVVGMSLAAGAIEVASTAPPGVIWGGIRVALTTTMFGLLLLTLAVLSWLGLYFIRGRQLREV